MMNLALNAAITTAVSDVVLAFVAPVAALPATDLVAASGAFAMGIGGLALTKVLRRSRPSPSRSTGVVTALRPARLLRAMRHAA